jgi:hypothetical protein
MKVMAARMAEHADDIGTAMYLWKAVYDSTTDRDVRNTAVKHLESLRADAEIAELEKRVRAYREKSGAPPARWLDLVRAGLLAGIPQDPSGAAYKLMPDGTVQVEDLTKFPYLGQGRERKF